MLYTFSEWMLWREAITGVEGNQTLYHGCTTSSAHNIMSQGLQDRSEFDLATNMSGEFWATTNYAYASLMSFMPGYTEATPQDPPVVLQFKLPASALMRMKKGKHYEQHGVGAYEFRANCFNYLNKQIHDWKVLPLESGAQQKWQQELQKAA